MPYQNINASLSPEDLQQIKSDLASIAEKLPFLISLTKAERQQLYKMGDKSLTFVRDSLTAAQSNPGILPANFNLAGFEQDYGLVQSLSEIRLLLNQLNERVDDTLLAVGSEAMTSSRTIYQYVTVAAKTTPGLKTVAEQLGQRFKDQGKQKSKSKESTGSVS